MFNFVFFATEYDWYPFMYKDILVKENVLYFKSMSELLERTNMTDHSAECENENVEIFGKILKKIEFNSTRQICFVHFSRFLPYMKNGLLEAEKRVYPDCKTIHYFTDSRHITTVNINFLKNVDVVGVYDPNIARIFGLQFWPNSFPLINLPKVKLEYDLCFVGYGLGRTEDIAEIVKLCNASGLKTAVYIMEPDVDVEHIDGIYRLTKLMPYEKYLDLLNKSNCVLELERKNGFHACSMRVLEAVILNKKILTDNSMVYSMPCCSGKEEYIQMFDKSWKRNEFFLRDRGKVDFKYTGDYSGELFLKRIQNYFN